MEVEAENTSNHLQESTSPTVSNEILLENNSNNDKELGKEVPESNVEEEREESSVTSPKLDDPTSFVAVAVGETAGEKEASVQCGNSESGGCGNLVVAEPTSVLKDAKDGDGGAVKDETCTGDVAVVKHGGNELTNSGKLGGGECEAVVIVRDDGLNVAEENVKDSGEDANTDVLLVIDNDKDGGEGETEIVEADESNEESRE